MNSFNRCDRVTWALGLALLSVLAGTDPARAAISETGGSGVFEVQSAESKRPGRLELGFFGSYRDLALGDSADTRVNTLLSGFNAAIGFPGGLEASGTLPIYGYYSTLGSTSGPLDESVRLRVGDVDARLRWTFPFLIPGMRIGAEGGVRFPTGDDQEVAYPGRAIQKPYTSGEHNYMGRALATWDGLRAGTGIPLRLHANATYLYQLDESRFLLERGPLALDLPPPVGKRDNDVLTLAGAAEIDLARVTLFGEIVTDQFVNERSLLRGKENRLTVTPGVRLWIPGGLSIAGGYSIELSEDDPATSFNPDRAFPENEWRLALSLGTVYRSARAKLEDRAIEARAATAPQEPAAVATLAPADSARAVKIEREKRILERRPIQEAPASETIAEAAPEPVLPAEPDVTVRAKPAPPAPPSPAAPAPSRAEPQARQAGPVRESPVRGPAADADGDGIADDADLCPLLAEDWDGFQDLDGCPDLDNDQDGILDVRDQCPNDPETYNGYYDFDGCPDGPQRRWLPAPGSTSGTERDGAGLGPGAAVGDTMIEKRAAEAPAAPPAPAPPKKEAPAAAATPAPAKTVGAARAAPTSTPDATAAATAALEARVRDLEHEMLAMSGRSARAGAAPTPINAPTVIPMPTSRDADTAARLASLEAEIRSLREQRATETRASPARRPGAEAAPRDTTDRLMVERLAQIQASVDSLNRASQAAASEAAEAAPAEAEMTQAAGNSAGAASLAALDLLFPLGVARVIPEIQFESNSASLTPAGIRTIAPLAEAIRAVPESRISVVGHTDSIGEAEYNRSLSLERARTVAELMFAHGVARSQLTIEGRGEDAPITSNRTAEGRQMNRRVEFLRTR